MTVFSNRLIVIGSLLISAVSAAAFSQSTDDARGTVAPGIEASWRVTVTPVGVPIAPFLTFSTFGRGGTFLESSQPRQGPGHGVWRRTGQREFGITFEKIVFSADGSVTGTLKVRETITLSAAGDSYTGDGTAELYDTAGRLVASFCAKTEATRMSVEPSSCP